MKVFVTLHTEDDGTSWESETWQVVRSVHASEEQARAELDERRVIPDKRYTDRTRTEIVHDTFCCSIVETDLK